jgi:hypothetical protein
MRRVAFPLLFLAALSVPAEAALTVSSWKPAGAVRYLFFCWADALVDLPGTAPEGSLCSVEATNATYAYHDGAWAAISGAGGGAPTTVDYLVKTADAGLSAERAVTDTSTVTWDWGTSGQAKATAIGVTCTDCITATEIDESTLPASGLTHPQIMARLAVGGGY